MTEFNLSDKTVTYNYLEEHQDHYEHDKDYFLFSEDVKEFIKRLKEEIDKLGIQQTGIHRGYLKMFIDKLAGERLT